MIKICKKWIALILCMAVALMILPAPAVAADASHEHHYTQHWDWVYDSSEGNYKVTLNLICSECGTSVEGTNVSSNIVSQDDATPVSCTEDGEAFYEVKAVIDQKEYSSIRKVTIPATGHSYENPEWGTWKKDDTGKYTIEATATCSKCSQKTELDVTIMDGIQKNPTCTEEGLILYRATTVLNGEAYKTDHSVNLEATGHSYWIYDSVWKWNSQNQNYEKVEVTLKCSECGQTHNTESLEITEQVEKAATCTEPGKITYTASIKTNGNDNIPKCTVERPLPATGHNLKKTAAKAATCIKDGNSAYCTCTTCKKYFSEQGEKEIKKDSWVIKKKGHNIKTTQTKPTANKEGKIVYKCKLCNTVQETLVIPRKTIEVELGKSEKIISDPSKCVISLANPSKYKKYFSLNTKSGKITTKKNYSTKISDSIPVKVKTSNHTYTVNVKVKIPAPKITIIRKKIGSYYRYTFKYNIKGADRIQVRCNLKGLDTEKLDKYLSNPKSNKDSYVNINLGKMKKIKFTIIAYYGKNASKPTVITK